MTVVDAEVDAVTVLDLQWSKAIELCRRGLRDEGYSPATVEKVSKHVARFGRECGWAPWDVDTAIVDGWLATVDAGSSVRRMYQLRTSLRTFYRWALRTGRMRDDPTAQTSRTVTPRQAPDSWHHAIDAYRRRLQAAKLTEGTVRLRVYQLTRASIELPVKGPWDVTTEQLTDWLAGHTWGRNSVYSYRNVLRGFYGWAEQSGYVDRNPAADLPGVRMPKRVPRPAPDDAYRSALRAAGPRERLMLRLAREIGLRANEIATVHTEDVQLGIEDAGWWLQVLGKGDKVRYLPLPDDLARALRALPDGWVFPGRVEGHVSRPTVTRKVARLLPDHWTAHTLRHRFATSAYALDHDLLAVQQMLGHARPETTRIYVDVPESRLRRIITTMGAV